MDYKYLAEFARNAKTSGLFYRKVLRWRDQYALVFNNNEYLQISLLQQEPCCFFTNRQLIEWTEAVELAMMHQHLSRAKLENISISQKDRIIFLDFSRPDPFEKIQKYRLILELIPQFGNIILTKKHNNKNIIIDCAKKISLAENKRRQLLPAVEYEEPPALYKNADEKLNFPLGFNEKMQITENSPRGWNDINDCLEALYYEGWLHKLSEHNLNNHLQSVSREIIKKQKKLDKLQAELLVAEKESRWLQMGELLKAQQHRLKPGMNKVTLVNYYDDELPEIEIDLDHNKPVLWNINQYFKKYRKARTGKKKIAEQIKMTRQEIADLHKQLQELNEIDLLLPGQIIQHETGRNSVLHNITRLPVDENWEFLFGRNSTENDLLTTRIARPDDWWFHTRIFKGTHVVLRNQNKNDLPEHLLQLGCRIAAYYSKAAKSENVPVDYTQIRYVRKPRGSAPGFVTYSHQKTLFVNPLSLRQAREIIAKWTTKTS